MCQFKSAIWTRKGLLYSLDTDKHETLIKENNLDDSSTKPDFVRIEFVPKSNYFESYKRIDDFDLRIDQDLIPSWFTEKSKKECNAACKKMIERVWDERFINTDTDKIEKGEGYIIIGGTVSEVWGGTVNAVRGGTVNEVRGGTVNEVWGGTVNEVRGGTVNAVRGGTVNAVRGGTVNEVRGDSKILFVRDSVKMPKPQEESFYIQNGIIVHNGTLKIKKQK